MSDMDEYISILSKLQGKFNPVPEVIWKILNAGGAGKMGLTNVGAHMRMLSLWDDLYCVYEIIEKLQHPKVIENLLSMAWLADFPALKPQLDQLHKLFQQEDLPRINEIMINRTREGVEHCLGLLEKYYPERLPLVIQAKNAGDHGWYAPAIMLLLAQGDGITAQTHVDGKGFFGKQNKLGWQKYPVPEDRSRMMQLFLMPLYDQTTLDYSKSQRDLKNEFDEFYHRMVTDNQVLNRHRIMHGEATDFATELNYWKSWSFLEYILFAMDEVVRA